MTNRSAFCIATSRIQAELIVDSLRAADFANSDVSVLFHNQEATPDFVHENHTKVPEGAVAGTSAGCMAGGALGWITGIGVLSISGAGPFIGAGPIVPALSRLGVGGIISEITRALMGCGISEFEAGRYEAKIKAGNILIAVHTDNAEELVNARRIFRREGGDYISSTSDAPVPKAARANYNGGHYGRASQGQVALHPALHV